MIQGAAWTICLSTGMVVLLLFFSTIALMVTPTESASDYKPLVRTREPHSSTGETSNTDPDVQKLIDEVFTRKGYSNPDPSSHETIDPLPEEVRPKSKIGPDFDPSKSYVIKHPNGTLTYAPPKESLIQPSSSKPSRTYGSSVSSSVTTTDATSTRKAEASTSNGVAFRNRRCLSDNCSTDSTFIVDPPPSSSDEECSPEKPICTAVDNYPDQMINSIVSKHKERFAEVFGNDVVVEDGDRLVQRFDGSDLEPLCESEERIIHPKEGFTKEDQKIQIVNTQDYTQGVRIELCRTSGKPCESLSPMLTKTECKQLYHYRTLLAIDPKSNQPYKEKFRLPSCCKCFITRQYRRRRDTEGL